MIDETEPRISVRRQWQIGRLPPQRVVFPVWWQAHFVERDSLLLRLMQELLHAHVPLGGRSYLFKQVTADKQERGEVGLRLEHGGGSCQTGGGLDPLTGFVGIDVIPRQGRGVIHSGDSQEGFIPDAGMVSTIVAQHAQGCQPGIESLGISAP